MAIYDTAKEIINRVALQVGLEESVSPFASADPKYKQLCSLLGTAGMELIELGAFQRHVREATITTDAGGTGTYPLESDFDSMVNQTMWDRANANPIDGSLTPQDWQYRLGSGLDSETIYMSFRLVEGYVKILPLPNPDLVDLTYEYLSNAWVLEGASTFKKVPTADADSILIRPTLIQAYLRCLWRESKGMPSQADRNTLQLMFDAGVGKDTPGKVLSLTKRPAFPYLSADNLPDTGFGT